jgi:UDP-N-acetylglucosamine 4,6-dehydratase (inverting)
MLKYFKDKSILITGGTGSFGSAFVRFLIKKNIPLKKIIIFSRDELKQHDLYNEFGNKYDDILRFFLGDVRDLQRLETAFSNVDIVIHAAALKQVPAAEYNPIEFIKTNVIGSQNVVEAALRANVKKVILLSTDKASSPINLYGATKLCADKLFISANNVKGNKNISFSVVRYGNVMGSRGSVIEVFKKQYKKFGKVYLTDPRMTRFNIFMEEAIKLVLWSISKCKGGEVIIPKLPSFYIKDLASLISNNHYKISNIRVGEKIHEEMISVTDSRNTYEFNDKYIIVPEHLKKFYKKNQGKIVPEGFVYSSINNKKFLSKNNLQKVLKKFKIL